MTVPCDIPLGLCHTEAQEHQSVTQADCTKVMDRAWFPGLEGNLAREKDVVKEDVSCHAHTHTALRARVCL